jgi:cAMP phosphodiesterase
MGYISTLFPTHSILLDIIVIIIISDSRYDSSKSWIVGLTLSLIKSSKQYNFNKFLKNNIVSDKNKKNTLKLRVWKYSFGCFSLENILK